MENAALNVAHQQHRRAETHLLYKRFDDAIQCHHNAAESIKEAMKLTKVTKALDSLTLQYDYHVRQQEIVKLKKAQFEIFSKALENQKKMANIFKNHGQLPIEDMNSEKACLQTAIYRAMEEADSLLELLVKRGGESDGDEVDGLVHEEGNSREQTPQPVVEGKKRPKDDHTVIEELHTLNHQLRDLVSQLVTQLDARTQEVERLRSRIRVLEASAGSDGRRSSESGVSGTRLHVITDSIGGTSPFVFSPCSELSPDVIDTHIGRELPVLAPLEMPNFDFSIFSKTSDSSL